MPRLNRDRWSLDYDLMPGGIVLTDVRHDHFNVARDIRTVRVWVDTEYPAFSNAENLKNYVLHGPGLPADGGAISLVEPGYSIGVVVNETPFFRGFNNLFGLWTRYSSSEPYLAGSPNEARIELGQRFLFTDYGKNPAHEPGGVLDACRLFPILEFRFPRVQDPSRPYPKFFRADYRLDVSLDNIDESDIENDLRRADTVTNKAAIFRDKEDLPGIFGQAFAGLRIAFSPITSGGPNIEEIFAAFEKPLSLEIASWGLLNGVRPLVELGRRRHVGLTPQHAWDNLHIWPAVRGVTRDPVSTPGAFHAFHCHWRWGAVSGDPEAQGLLLAQAGGRQFTGVGWSVSEGGPLVDPRIARQNLLFAITKNDSSEWAAQRNPSEPNFFELFSNRRSEPSSIGGGADLVLWISFAVFRGESELALAQSWGGDLFPNGFYFAHNEDQTPLAVRVGGGYGEGAFPPVENQWWRLARPFF